MATAGNTIAGINVALGLQSAAFLRGIERATAATASATQKMQRDLNKMNSTFTQTGRAVSQFANAFSSMFAVQQVTQAAKAVADYSDSWQMASNKIAAAEQISGRSARSLSEVNKIAIETRSSLDATADLYAKMLRVTGDVAESEEEVARATRIVSEGFKAGGASTLEMENGIRQLAQAMGSGFLQGDELRSIRENAPLIAQALAEEFDTTIGGLKKLGAEGKITSDRIFKAILAAEGPIGSAFSRTNSTIAESFTNVNNALTQYIGTASKSSGVAAGLSSGLNHVATNFQTIADAATRTNPFTLAVQMWGIYINAAVKGFELLDEAVNPSKIVDAGESMSTTADQVFQMNRVVDKTTGEVDAMSAALGKLAIAGKGAAAALPNDLFAMADTVNFNPNKAQDLFPKFNTKAANEEVIKNAKKIQDTHKMMLRDVGNFSEQYAQKIEDIGKAYPSAADAARVGAEALRDHNAAILNALEGFGASISPMEKYDQKVDEINARFEEGSDRARALAGANQELTRTYEGLAQSLGVVLSPSEQLLIRLREIGESGLPADMALRAISDSTMAAAESEDALRTGLGLSLSPMEAHEAMLRKIAMAHGANVTAAQSDALATQAYGDALDQQTQRMGMQLDPIAQFAAAQRQLAVEQANGVNTTQGQIAAHAALAASTLDLAGQVTTAFSGLFKENKALAVANAVISTAEAIAKTLAMYGATPWGLVAAGVAAAAGAAQIATILSTQPGSANKPSVKSGGGGGKIKAVSDAGKASTASSSSSGSSKLNQTVTVIVEGDSFGPEHFKKMVEGLNGVIADGAVLRMGNR